MEEEERKEKPWCCKDIRPTWVTMVTIQAATKTEKDKDREEP